MCLFRCMHFSLKFSKSEWTRARKYSNVSWHWMFRNWMRFNRWINTKYLIFDLNNECAYIIKDIVHWKFNKFPQCQTRKEEMRAVKMVSCIDVEAPRQLYNSRVPLELIKSHRLDLCACDPSFIDTISNGRSTKLETIPKMTKEKGKKVLSSHQIFRMHQ